MLFLTMCLLHGASLVGTQPSVGIPVNVTVMFVEPTIVRISWASMSSVERFDVHYKQTDSSSRIIDVVAGNANQITLSNLQPDTQYQVTVTAIMKTDGKKLRSRPIVFRTLEAPGASKLPTHQLPSYNKPTAAVVVAPSSEGGVPRSPPTYAQVRGVEIGLVLLALCVWFIAIFLFFHRWGKIRMLLPYQPDYKTTQTLKVPGTGTSSTMMSTKTNNARSSNGVNSCVQSVFDHLTSSSCCYERIPGGKAEDDISEPET